MQCKIGSYSVVVLHNAVVVLHSILYGLYIVVMKNIVCYILLYSIYCRATQAVHLCLQQKAHRKNGRQLDLSVGEAPGILTAS